MSLIEQAAGPALIKTWSYPEGLAGYLKELAATGLLDGVTTNPSLIMKSGRDFIEVTREICGIVAGPVSAEVVALDHAGMMQEAEKLRKIADNVCIKVPLTLDGLKTCKALTSDGTMVNVTLCFSANQALLAAKAGATFISPFVGRILDWHKAARKVDSIPAAEDPGVISVTGIYNYFQTFGYATSSGRAMAACDELSPPCLLRCLLASAAAVL